jgi:hypothetical protein
MKGKAGRGGRSVGLSIRSANRGESQPALDVQLKFDHFASRKVAFCRHSKAFLFFPEVWHVGRVGRGTDADSVRQVAQRARTALRQDVLAGNAGLMQERMLDAGLIGEHDLDRLVFCNKPAEAIAALMHEDGSLRSTEYDEPILIEHLHAPLWLYPTPLA